MSAIISGRVYWTSFPPLSYQQKGGKIVKVKESTAKIVLLAIADSSDDYGENSWNSFETLATKTGIKRRSVIRVARVLIESGYLKIAGVTKYGTNNFSVSIEKLGNAPVRRSVMGRPKTSDSVTKTSDSVTKTSDSTSPYPSFNHPVSINNDEAEISERVALLSTLFQSNVGMITPLLADMIRNAAIDYPKEWYEPAIKIAVENGVRKWGYVETIMENWKIHGRDWKPQQERKNGAKKGNTARPGNGRGESGTHPDPTPDDLELARELVEQRKSSNV